MDQILTKADFILDRVMIFEMPNKSNFCVILNIDGSPTVSKVEYCL